MTEPWRDGSIEVITAGLLTSVQGLPRTGLRHLGVSSGGAADAWSHALANLLVGNAADASTLEMTLSGPILRFHAAARIAVCGARIEARANGIEIPGNRPVDLPAGTTLAFGPCRDGARSYLAVAGGLDIPVCLGSPSTDLRAGFGGIDGRPLRRGDTFSPCWPPTQPPDQVQVAPWWIDASASGRPRPAGSVCVVRMLPGPDHLPALADAQWRVDARSNRQGLRLQGPALAVIDQRERVSEPVAPGTVQLPPDGQPIILLADAQTHGGYPRVGHVIAADAPLLAQLRPGERLRLATCDDATARQAWRAQQQRLNRARLAIQARLTACASR